MEVAEDILQNGEEFRVRSIFLFFTTSILENQSQLLFHLVRETISWEYT